MDNTTIIAIVIFAGVFVLMVVTIIKDGVQGAIKLWSVMGALTGIAFGSITSYYFTNKSNQQIVQKANASAEMANQNLKVTKEELEKTRQEAAQFSSTVLASVKNDERIKKDFQEALNRVQDLALRDAIINANKVKPPVR